MTIDIAHLEDQLLHMSAEGAPGQEFCEAISELARTGRFEQLRDVLPGIVYDELWNRYEQDPVAFVAGWRLLAQEMQQGFIQHARQRLTSLTRLQQAGIELLPRGRRSSVLWMASRTICCAPPSPWSCWSW